MVALADNVVPLTFTEPSAFVPAVLDILDHRVFCDEETFGVQLPPYLYIPVRFGLKIGVVHPRFWQFEKSMVMVLFELANIVSMYNPLRALVVVLTLGISPIIIGLNRSVVMF